MVNNRSTHVVTRDENIDGINNKMQSTLNIFDSFKSIMQEMLT